MCLTGNYTERGIKGRHGFHAEYVVDQECYAVKVPQSITHIAVLTEPMSVVQKAIEETVFLQMARLAYLKNDPNWLEGKKVLVAGLGTIGLLAAIVLRLKGAQVLGLDVKDETAVGVQILKAIGGTYFNDKGVDPVEFQKNHPHIDLILDAAGVAKLDFDLLGALGINGIFVLTGVPGMQHAISLDGALLMKNMVLKNQVMVGSVNESIAHFENGLKDLEEACKKWPGVVERLISKRFPYTDFEKAFAEHLPNEVKVVIDWS
jgi:threonine dehydrogenase-like Zn-dependent dehydrogenase